MAHREWHASPPHRHRLPRRPNGPILLHWTRRALFDTLGLCRRGFDSLQRDLFTPRVQSSGRLVVLWRPPASWRPHRVARDGLWRCALHPHGACAQPTQIVAGTAAAPALHSLQAYYTLQMTPDDPHRDRIHAPWTAGHTDVPVPHARAGSGFVLAKSQRGVVTHAMKR